MTDTAESATTDLSEACDVVAIGNAPSSAIEPGSGIEADAPADDTTTQSAGSVTVRRRGAPRGNANGLRHGLRSAGSVMDFRLTLGKFPPKWRYIENAINVFRRIYEQAVIDRHGSINEYRAAVLQTAARWETHAMLARRWLMDDIETLKQDQRLAYHKAIAEASRERDRCLKDLGLSDGTRERTKNAWEELREQQVINILAPEKNGTKPATTDQPEQPTDGT